MIKHNQDEIEDIICDYIGISKEEIGFHDSFNYHLNIGDVIGIAKSYADFKLKQLENQDEFTPIITELPLKGVNLIGIDSNGEKISCFRCACKNENCQDFRCTITGSNLMVKIIKWKYE